MENPVPDEGIVPSVVITLEMSTEPEALFPVKILRFFNQLEKEDLEGFLKYIFRNFDYIIVEKAYSLKQLASEMRMDYET